MLGVADRVVNACSCWMHYSYLFLGRSSFFPLLIFLVRTFFP